MGFNRAAEEAIKIWIALGGVILAVIWPWIPKKKLREGLLLALAVLAFMNYARYDFSRFSTPDAYDLLHYYLNSRYFDELGYFDLYPAMIVADQENGAFDRRLNRFRYQDREEGYRRQSLRFGYQRGREIREENFTPERWDAFEADFLFIQRELRFPRSSWRNLMDDRGYNGTPAWTLLAMPIAKAVSTDNLRILCFLDVLWLIAAMLAVRRAYGQNAMLWCIFFFFVTYSWRWAVPGIVFLRHDWVSCLIITACLIKLGRPVLAGAFTGYAALMRLFPAVWLYGLVAKAVARLYEEKKLDLDKFKQPAKVIIGFAVAMVVIEGAATGYFGFETIKTHAESIAEHITPEELSSRRVGFAIGYGHTWSVEPRHIQDSRKREIAEASKERLIIAFILLIALAWGIRRLPDDQVYALGFIPFFLLASASYYYYSMRVTMVLFHASDMSKWRNRIGLALLLGIEVFCNAAETLYPRHRMFLVGGLSQLLFAYVLIMTGWLIIEARRADSTTKSTKGTKDTSKKITNKASTSSKNEAEEMPEDEKDDVSEEQSSEDLGAEKEDSPESQSAKGRGRKRFKSGKKKKKRS